MYQKMPPVRAASFLICGNTVTEDAGINPIIITNANSTLKNCFETLFFISLSSFSGIHFICHTSGSVILQMYGIREDEIFCDFPTFGNCHTNTKHCLGYICTTSLFRTAFGVSLSLKNGGADFSAIYIFLN